MLPPLEAMLPRLGAMLPRLEAKHLQKKEAPDRHGWRLQSALFNYIIMKSIYAESTTVPR